MTDLRRTKERLSDADYIIYLDPRPEEVSKNQDIKFQPMMALRGLAWGCLFGAMLWLVLYWLGEAIR